MNIQTGKIYRRLSLIHQACKTLEHDCERCPYHFPEGFKCGMWRADQEGRTDPDAWTDEDCRKFARRLLHIE